MNVQRVMELLAFDEEAGEFRWRRNLAGRFRAGKVAGCVGNHGYVAIGLDGKDYLAHRLVWFISHGEWPEEFIDHKTEIELTTGLKIFERQPRVKTYSTPKSGEIADLVSKGPPCISQRGDGMVTSEVTVAECPLAISIPPKKRMQPMQRLRFRCAVNLRDHLKT